VRDQIDLQQARARIRPVREGAHRNLLAHEVARSRNRGAAAGELRPRRRQHPRQGRPTDSLQELLHVGRDREFSPPDQPVQQLGDERLQAMGADPPTRLPQHFRRGRHLGPVRAGAATAARARPRPGARPSSRIAALRCSPVTATISSNSWCFSARAACWYRNRCTAAYSRKLARVTGPSRGNW
jgi:hypothetical protein